ncbi:unnamed protein product [Clavelina lepadiformis]|uniref:Uncharacterized protein n=1 Tax=Clavelina lepadiformis TaxID=159417 RepID=A0ABP0G6Z6_CLALP
MYVKELDISYNIIKDIPGPEFFAKIEEYLRMTGCFEDGSFDANSSEKQKIQLALDSFKFQNSTRSSKFERETKNSTRP